MRAGPTFAPPDDRDAQIAALLTVHAPAGPLPSGGEVDDGWRGFASDHLLDGHYTSAPRRHYRGARLAPGDIVTILGMALPFDQLADPTGADGAGSVDPVLADPEIAADLASARAAGTLRSPEGAWGNAAIPGFGIGRPVRTPELDDAVTEPPLAAADDAQRFERTFEIAADALILAASETVPLVIAGGPPVAAADRQERLFLIGLLGAVLAIGSAMAMAVMVGGGIGGP
jgi:hypothetical protein